MDGAKDLAKDMLEANNVDDSGFIAALVKGLYHFLLVWGIWPMILWTQNIAERIKMTNTGLPDLLIRWDLIRSW